MKDKYVWSLALSLMAFFLLALLASSVILIKVKRMEKRKLIERYVKSKMLMFDLFGSDGAVSKNLRYFTLKGY